MNTPETRGRPREVKFGRTGVWSGIRAAKRERERPNECTVFC